ncbi:MAG: flippase [Candidatus Nanohalobium sp.]
MARRIKALYFSRQEKLDTAMSLASRLAKGASITFTGLLISKFIAFFYRITVGRGLGPEQYGYLTLGIASFFLAQNLSNISVDEAIERYVPENRERTSRYLYSALRVSLPLSILAAAVMFIFAEQLVALANMSSEMTSVIRIMAIGVPFGVASSSLNSVFVAHEKIRYQVYGNQIYQNIFKLLSGITALALGLGLWGVTWGFTLSVITSVMLTAYYLKTRMNLSLPEDTNSRKIVKYSWPLFFSGLMGFVLSWTDTIMIGYFTGSGAQIGIYNAAFPLARTLTIFMGATTTIAFPIMSKLHGENRKKEMKKLYQTNTRWVLMFATPAFLIMALFPEEILHLTFGREYLPAANTLRILSAGMFAGTLVGPTGVILKSTDNQKYTMYNSVFTTAANVLMNVALIPVFGILGAAYASIASSLIGNFAGAAESYIEEGIHAFHTGLMPIAVSSLTSLAATYAGLKLVQPVTPLWTLVPGAAVFGAIYIILLVMMGGIKEDDRDIIVGAGKKIDMEEEAEKIADTVIR